MLFADESMTFRFAKVAFQLPEVTIIVKTIKIILFVDHIAASQVY